MASKKRVGRPSEAEKEVSVVTGQLISWALPGGKRDRYEMMSPDDLLTRKGWRVYREMLADDQVKACLWYKKALLCARPYDLKPGDDSAESKEAADFVHKNLLDINFQTLLWEALSAFEFGFSTGEIVWEISGGYPSADKPMMKLKTIKSRDPEYMYVEVDSHGNLMEFIQRPSSGPSLQEIRLKPEKVFHYAYQRQFSNHYGVSDLRAAYRAWWSKKYITQFWNVFLERFGAPLMAMKYPPGATTELKNTLKEILNGLSSKTDILVPEGVVIELIEATRAGQAKYDEALTHYDVRIATSMLIPALLGMGVDTKRGSDSQSRLHLRTLMKLIQFIGNELSKEIQDKIVKPLCDANFNLKEYPQFMFQDYGEFEAFEITDAIKEMFNAGLISPDQEDVNFARSILGMPVRTEENPDEIINIAKETLDATIQQNEESNKIAKDGLKQKGAQQSNKNAKKPVSSRKTDSRTGRTRPSRRNGN
jgi:phage gp29-like protein